MRRHQEELSSLNHDGISNAAQLLSHYEYAVYAVITRGNTEDAIQRIQKMQHFKQTYGIQDTIEEGLQAIHDFINLQPGVLLHIDRSRRPQQHSDDAASTSLTKRSFLVAFRGSNFIPARSMKSEENWKITIVFFYYITVLQSYNWNCYLPQRNNNGNNGNAPQRVGTTILLEASDFGWSNIDMDFEHRLDAELYQHAPIQYKELLVYNTNSIVNMFFGMIKRILTTNNQWSSVRLGCTIEPLQFPTLPREVNHLLHALMGSPPSMKLDELLLLPNYEMAMTNLLRKVKTLLEERYHNEQTFQI